MRDISEWLDCRVTRKQSDELFPEQAPVFVQFRYVIEEHCWHFGRFGQSTFRENYAPYKTDKTWVTAPARNMRPVISACYTHQTVTHDEVSLVAVASPAVCSRICRTCQRILIEERDRVLANSPGRRRAAMLERMLKHAAPEQRSQLPAPMSMESMPLQNELLRLETYAEQNCAEHDYFAVCQANAFGW